MPFDPKLIRDEGDAGFEGDLKLPDDFALLGEQLGDDAARLAAAYPPPAAKVVPVVAASRQRRGAWMMRTFAGTALAVGLVTISLVAMNPRKVGNLATPTAPSTTAGPAVDLGDKPLGSLLATSPKSPSDPKIPVTPASYLGDASGP